MVMPRSRSRSMESSTCASISRACSAPVSSRKRSASVDFPWSIWAMMAKFLTRWGSINRLQTTGLGLRTRPGQLYCVLPEGRSLEPGASSRESASIERKIRLRVCRTDVLRARADQAVVRVLLQHVRRPAGDAAHGKHGGEQLRWDAERVI